MPGFQHLIPCTSPCGHLRLHLSLSSSTVPCDSHHVPCTRQTTAQGEPACRELARASPHAPASALSWHGSGISAKTSSPSALGQGRGLCRVHWWCYQGAPTHSTAWFDHMTWPPASSPTPVPSSSSAPIHAKWVRADHPAVRATSGTVEAQPAAKPRFRAACCFFTSQRC